MTSTRIIIFENQKKYTKSIVNILKSDAEFVVVGAFDTIKNCVFEVNASSPDVILMDIEMPKEDGTDAIGQLKAIFPHTPILVQTVLDDDRHVFDSIIAGANGYLLKNELNCCLKKAIRDLRKGGAPMSPPVARTMVRFIQRKKPNEGPAENYKLTARERETLEGIVNGLSYKMIAHDMGISYETVRCHIKKVYEKLDVGSLTEAVAKAIYQNIV